MFEGKKVLVVVPARGGSKSIEMKNIQPLNGVPLVAIAGHLIKGLTFVDKAVVSTDHPQIAKIARESGLEVPFMRPAELSGDCIGDWDVLAHALSETEKTSRTNFDIIVMLQPTSPLRKKEHVEQTVRKLTEEGWDSVWTVSETDSKQHPFKQLKIQGGAIEYYDERAASVIARQQLEPLYHKNGAAYAVTRDCLVKQRSIKGKRCGALVIDDPLVNIDTPQDLKLAEFFLKENPE